MAQIASIFVTEDEEFKKHIGRLLRSGAIPVSVLDQIREGVVPDVVFVDARGVVRGRIYGETSRSSLQPAISDLLAGRDVRPV